MIHGILLLPVQLVERDCIHIYKYLLLLLQQAGEPEHIICITVNSVCNPLLLRLSLVVPQ